MLFIAEMRHFKEGAIRGKDSHVFISDDQRVWEFFERLKKLRAVSVALERRRAFAPDLDHKPGFEALAEHGCGEVNLLATGQFGLFRDARTGGQRLGGHAFHGARGAGQEEAREIGAHETVGLDAERFAGRAIRRFDQQFVGCDDQDRLGDRFEHHLVARFGLPHARIVTLDILLRLHQPLLQF